jgi:hypothetical protein
LITVATVTVQGEVHPSPNYDETLIRREKTEFWRKEKDDSRGGEVRERLSQV